MMNMLIKWILLAMVIMLIAWIIPGITISGFGAALIVVIVMGLINALIRPVAELISMPLNVVTLGLFSLVINALLFILVAKFSPGFQINGFISGLLGAIMLSILAPVVDKVSVTKN